MWRITYKSFSLQEVLTMASMNVMEAKPCAEALGLPAFGCVATSLRLGRDVFRQR